MVHSSWSFVIESLSLAVPFLCVGVTREPQLYFSKRQIDFGEVPVGASRWSTYGRTPFVLCSVQKRRLYHRPTVQVAESSSRLTW